MDRVLTRPRFASMIGCALAPLYVRDVRSARVTSKMVSVNVRYRAVKCTANSR